MSFDHQPVLEGRLVVLRPMRPDDYQGLLAAAADPLIWEQHPVRNRHEEQEFRAFFDDCLASGGALVVSDAQTGATIGSPAISPQTEAGMPFC